MSDARLKLHRRDVVLDRRTFTALSLRPSAAERFATNYFHDTWHVIGSEMSCRLLGRPCWALGYQRRERTMIVLDPSVLVANPFDAHPSSPIAIVNRDLGTPTRAGYDALRAKLPWRTASEGTVTLSTPSLTAGLAVQRRSWADARWRESATHDPERNRRWIDEVNGMVVLSATSRVLREWGLDLSVLGDAWYRGADSTYLDSSREGEVQAVRDFDAMAIRAVDARRRRFPGRDVERLSPHEREIVWFDGERVAALRSDGP